MKAFLLLLCFTDWICTTGGGKTFIAPYSSIDQSHYYTEHHIDFGDGTDTTFIGEYSPISLAYQTIAHTYSPGIHIVTLTTSFYDSTTNLLLCTSVKQDTICPNNITYINEIKKPIKHKMYDLQGIELLKAPKRQIYIKNRRLYYELCN